jgi:hypothetical protein
MLRTPGLALESHKAFLDRDVRESTIKIGDIIWSLLKCAADTITDAHELVSAGDSQHKR